MFQSPRSGKFESNTSPQSVKVGEYVKSRFNPLDRGNLNQIFETITDEKAYKEMFQSPRSGKFESNFIISCRLRNGDGLGFNPLDRGNLNQISSGSFSDVVDVAMFQSPRSGKFESNSLKNTLRLTMSF